MRQTEVSAAAMKECNHPELFYERRRHNQPNEEAPKNAEGASASNGSSKPPKKSKKNPGKMKRARSDLEGI